MPTPDDGWVRQRLAQAHPTTINPQDFARETAEQQVTRLLAAFAAWDGVLLVDNYETVQYALAENRAAAQAIHALFWQLATQGCRLLLTTRERPAELPHETTCTGKLRWLG
jgi:NADPH-dependent glutamate synthase beta subunit-like oxidoreductase